jgi:hypothetical protein
MIAAAVIANEIANGFNRPPRWKRQNKMNVTTIKGKAISLMLTNQNKVSRISPATSRPLNRDEEKN